MCHLANCPRYCVVEILRVALQGEYESLGDQNLQTPAWRALQRESDVRAAAPSQSVQISAMGLCILKNTNLIFGFHVLSIISKSRIAVLSH